MTPSNVNRGTFGPEDSDEPGFSSAIFCDIEKPVARRCATTTDIEGGIRLEDAAIALVEGRRSTIGGLDYSEEALSRCAGQPEVVEFFGPFPDGRNVCLNCGTAIGPDPDIQHPNNAAVCRALCLDLFDPDDDNEPPSDAAIAFCTTERARLSTNFPADSCFTGACSITGALNDPFDDPRRHPEAVDWTNLNGVSASGGTLTRTAPTTGFSDAGASSSQLIAGGDAYFEFTVSETTTARAAGLSNGPPPPGGIVFTDIGFGILLLDNQIHVLQDGNSVGTFGEYFAGDRLRVKLRENPDGSAAVSFARVIGPCVDGSTCSEAAIEPPIPFTATYPVRVDAMFREQGGTVTDAKIVRIR